LIGTPWFPPLEAFEEAIVFWEASGEDKYSIHAMLLRLETMGIFARIKGMVIGRQHWVNEWLKGIEYPSFREVVVDACKHYHFPILADVDFGHGGVNVPMPLGIRVAMDSGQRSLRFLEACVIDTQEG
jgi:muramoyltetrapeptide carboxypeptidase